VRGQPKPRAVLPAVPATPALAALEVLVRRWLLTLEQEHEHASHQDPDELISDKTCRVCAGIEDLWAALKAAAAQP
jgi:hypothetical protein